MKKNRFITRNMLLNALKYLIIIDLIAIIIGFIINGFVFTFENVSNSIFVVGGIIAVIGWCYYMIKWMDLRKIVRETPRGEEIYFDKITGKRFLFISILLFIINNLISLFFAMYA